MSLEIVLGLIVLGFVLYIVSVRFIGVPLAIKSWEVAKGWPQGYKESKKEWMEVSWRKKTIRFLLFPFSSDLESSDYEDGIVRTNTPGCTKRFTNRETYLIVTGLLWLPKFAIINGAFWGVWAVIGGTEVTILGIAYLWKKLVNAEYKRFFQKILGIKEEKIGRPPS